MVLASLGPLLTPPPSSSPLKTSIWSYSPQTPPRNENQTHPQPGCSCCSRLGRVTGGQNGPHTDADVLRHPRHSSTAQRPSADHTTANQTTTNKCFSSCEEIAEEKRAAAAMEGAGQSGAAAAWCATAMAPSRTCVNHTSSSESRAPMYSQCEMIEHQARSEVQLPLMTTLRDCITTEWAWAEWAGPESWKMQGGNMTLFECLVDTVELRED